RDDVNGAAEKNRRVFSGGAGNQAEAAEIDRGTTLKHFLGRVGGTAAGTAAGEEFDHAVAERPDVVRDHAGGWPAVGGQVGGQTLGGATQHTERAVSGLGEVGIAGDRDAALEHRDVVARVLAGEVEIGPAGGTKRRQDRG